ncbi:PsiF family protein [Methylobacterium sp. E-041]
MKGAERKRFMSTCLKD